MGRAINKSIAIVAFTNKHDEELATVLLEESGFHVITCATNDDLIEELDAKARQVAMIFADTDRGDAAASRNWASALSPSARSARAS